jgi:hypothetical protein
MITFRLRRRVICVNGKWLIDVRRFSDKSRSINDVASFQLFSKHGPSLFTFNYKCIIMKHKKKHQQQSKYIYTHKHTCNNESLDNDRKFSECNEVKWLKDKSRWWRSVNNAIDDGKCCKSVPLNDNCWINVNFETSNDVTWKIMWTYCGE